MLRNIRMLPPARSGSNSPKICLVQLGISLVFTGSILYSQQEKKINLSSVVTWRKRLVIGYVTSLLEFVKNPLLHGLTSL